MVDFYQDKGIGMLKLGCTLPNLAHFCLHKSAIAQFYPVTESDKEFLEKISEDMVVGSTIVFTRKAVVAETFIRDSTNRFKSIVGNDAGLSSFLYVSSNAIWSLHEMGTSFGIK